MIPTLVGMIPTLIGMIPTLVGMIPTLVGMISTLVGMIPTLQEDVLHFVPSVGIFLTKFRNISYKILAKFSIKHYTCRNHASYTCRNHASYTSVKFLPALYLKIMISYLVWNMLSACMGCESETISTCTVWTG